MLGPVHPDRIQAERLAAVARAAFQDGGRGWRTDDLLVFAGQPGAVIIADGALAAGMALLRVVVDEAELLEIGVVPRERGRGLGRVLLGSAEHAAKGLGALRMHLEVASDNAPARALYARAGYAPVGLRRGYYRRPGGARVDALLLARALADAGAPG